MLKKYRFGKKYFKYSHVISKCITKTFGLLTIQLYIGVKFVILWVLFSYTIKPDSGLIKAKNKKIIIKNNNTIVEKKFPNTPTPQKTPKVKKTKQIKPLHLTAIRSE